MAIVFGNFMVVTDVFIRVHRMIACYALLGRADAHMPASVYCAHCHVR